MHQPSPEGPKVVAGAGLGRFVIQLRLAHCDARVWSPAMWRDRPAGEGPQELLSFPQIPLQNFFAESPWHHRIPWNIHCCWAPKHCCWAAKRCYWAAKVEYRSVTSHTRRSQRFLLSDLGLGPAQNISVLSLRRKRSQRYMALRTQIFRNIPPKTWPFLGGFGLLRQGLRLGLRGVSGRPTHAGVARLGGSPRGSVHGTHLFPPLFFRWCSAVPSGLAASHTKPSNAESGRVAANALAKPQPSKRRRTLSTRVALIARNHKCNSFSFAKLTALAVNCNAYRSIFRGTLALLPLIRGQFLRLHRA